MKNIEKPTIEDLEKRLSSVVKENLKRVIGNRLNKEYDFVLLIIGKVGEGKSMLAALSCCFVATLTGSKYTVDNVFFTAQDFRVRERKLKDKDSLDFDEGEEIFFSRRAMSSDQQKMILKFAQIRQRNFFIVICAPSLFLLEKWLRGIGKETRVDCIWRIVRRGMFLSYSAKTGSLQRIGIDKETNTVKYPECDFVGFWQPIPKASDFWKNYLDKKQMFLTATRESKKLEMQRKKITKLMEDSLTLREIAELRGVKIITVRGWLNKMGVFPKSSVFVDLTGKIRIKFKGYEVGIKKLQIMKQQQTKLLRAKKIEKRPLGKILR